MYSMTAHDKAHYSPVLISQTTGKVYPNTKEGHAAIDADEGRQRLTNDQMEAMIVLRGAYLIARKALPIIKPFCKRTGAGRMLAAAMGGMGKALEQIFCKVSSRQFKTLQANTTGVAVTVSSVKVPAMVNIDVDHLRMITDRALEACEMYCTASCQESKQCLLRRAYEQVPMLGEIQRGAGQRDCPYMGVRLE